MAKRGTILVVDDEEVMRDVLETLLSAEGYRVDLSKTGEEGSTRFSSGLTTSSCWTSRCRAWADCARSKRSLKLDAEAVVLMITAYATFDTAIAAWQKRRLQLHPQAVSTTNRF